VRYIFPLLYVLGSPNSLGFGYGILLVDVTGDYGDVHMVVGITYTPKPIEINSDDE